MSRRRPGSGLALRTRVFLAARTWAHALPRVYGMGDVCRALSDNDNDGRHGTMAPPTTGRTA